MHVKNQDQVTILNSELCGKIRKANRFTTSSMCHQSRQAYRKVRLNRILHNNNNIHSFINLFWIRHGGWPIWRKRNE